MDEVGRLQPEARRQHAVARRRRAAALDVAERRDARLVAGAVLDLLAEHLADAAQEDVAEEVGRRRLLGDLLLLARVERELVALAHDDDGERLPAVVALA